MLLGGGEEFCQKPVLYVRSRYLNHIWLVSYWNSFLLTWYIHILDINLCFRLVVPFIQGYVDTGEFGVGAKLMDSVKINFAYYGLMTVGLLAITLYMILNRSITTLYTYLLKYIFILICQERARLGL